MDYIIYGISPMLLYQCRLLYRNIQELYGIHIFISMSPAIRGKSGMYGFQACKAKITY